MNHKPQVTLTISEHPAQLRDRHLGHLGLLVIWGSICCLGNAIRQEVREVVFDLSELGNELDKHHGQAARSRRH